MFYIPAMFSSPSITRVLISDERDATVQVALYEIQK